MSELPAADAEELREVLRVVSSRLATAFGPVTIFEHGATCPNSTFGCGIDHAHLHAVCLPFDLLEVVNGARPEWSWIKCDEPWAGGPRQVPYLAISPPDGRWVEVRPESVPRQFFRQIIAKELGKAAAYDYDLYPRPENAALCVVALR
jgi:ATP adenylyltransferase